MDSLPPLSPTSPTSVPLVLSSLPSWPYRHLVIPSSSFHSVQSPGRASSQTPQFCLPTVTLGQNPQLQVPAHGARPAFVSGHLHILTVHDSATSSHRHECSSLSNTMTFLTQPTQSATRVSVSTLPRPLKMQVKVLT